jgi:3-methyladenine DNA glycosylase AlkD
VAELTVKTCPGVKQEEVLGVRIPKLRKIAKQLVKDDCAKKYISELNNTKKNTYMEEIILEGLVIAYSKNDLTKKLEHLKKYIPKINNWMINDTVCSTIKLSNSEQEIMWNFIQPYLKSENQFEVRFAVTTMLVNFLTDEYVDNVIQELNKVKNNGYYAEMAIAWTLAEIGIKFNDKAMKYLKGKNNLAKFTYNKTLQKMRESFRLLPEQKEELKRMKK